MAELLIRVVDKHNAEDPYLDAQCLKRGDVVVVCEDGHPWSETELTTPEWRVVRVPGVSVVQSEAFIGPEIEDNPAQPSRMLRRRAFKFDLDSPVAEKVLAKQGPTTLKLSPRQLWDLKKAKVRLEDPNILD